MALPRSVKEAFKRFDEEDDGLISTQELAKVFELLGFQCEESQLNLLFKHIDINADGKLSYEEFVDFVMRDVASDETGSSVDQQVKVTTLDGTLIATLSMLQTMERTDAPTKEVEKASQAPQERQVQVATLDGKLTTLSLPQDNQSIGELKKHIEQVTGVPAENVILIDGSVSLADDALIPAASSLTMVKLTHLSLSEFFAKLAEIGFTVFGECYYNMAGDKPGEILDNPYHIRVTWDQATGELYLCAGGHTGQRFFQEKMERLLSQIYNHIKPREDTVKKVYMSQRFDGLNPFYCAAWAFQVAHCTGETNAAQLLEEFDKWGMAKCIHGYTKTIQGVVQCLDDTDVEVRQSALHTLATAIALHDLDEDRCAEAISIIERTSVDVDLEVCKASLDILGKIGRNNESNKRIVNSIIARCLAVADAEVREAAFKAMGKASEEGDEKSRDALIQGLEDEYPAVRIAALEAMAPHLGSGLRGRVVVRGDQKAMQAVAHSLEDPDETVRAAAAGVSICIALEDDNWGINAIVRCLSDESALVNGVMVGILSGNGVSWCFQHAQIVEALIRCLAESSKATGWQPFSQYGKETYALRSLTYALKSGEVRISGDLMELYTKCGGTAIP